MSLAKFLIAALCLFVALAAGASIIMGPFSTAAAPTVMWQMDFELTSTNGCQDTLGDTCSLYGGTGHDGDYTTSPAPLEGSYSAVKPQAVYIYADSKFNNGTNDVTLDVLVNFTSVGTTTSNKEVIGLLEGTTDRCVAVVKPSNKTIWAHTNSGGSTFVIAADITYRLRLEFTRADDICKLYVDTTATDWGTGAVGISSQERTGWSGTVTRHPGSTFAPNLPGGI